MARLIMLDGTIKTVGYSTASSVHQVLIGNKEPKDDEQRKFIEGVERVLFDAPASLKITAPIDDTERITRRKKLIEIRSNKKLKGKAAYDAVREVLTGRPPEKPQKELL